MIKELDRIALITDLPEFHLRAGDVGTVVDITPNGKQYTLEFINFDGDTIAVVPELRLQLYAPSAAEK